MSGIKRQRAASLRTRATRGDRGTSGKLIDLAAELPGTIRGDRHLGTKSGPAKDLDRSLQHQPGRNFLLTDFVDHLSSREMAAGAAREALGSLDLCGGEDRKHLMLARIEGAHDEILSAGLRNGIDSQGGSSEEMLWSQAAALCLKSVEQVSTIGVDIAKRVFQVLPFLASQPPCSGAHHWGREILKFGHEMRLIPPKYVKPFVKRRKNDAAHAEAICEAAQRPTMRFVAGKSAAAQASGLVFRTRDLLVRQRTQDINALRGYLTEYGWVAKGTTHVAELIVARHRDR
jgi:hypothetical protein